MCNAQGSAREAAESGYWPLYRFNPAVIDSPSGSGKRLQLDSKRLKGDLEVSEHLRSRSRSGYLVHS